MLQIPYDCATHVFSWLPVRDRCALRAASAAYRRDFHVVRIGMIPHVFGAYVGEVFAGVLTPFNYFEHFASVLLDSKPCSRRRTYRSSTLLRDTPIPPWQFASPSEWKRYHFDHQAGVRHLDEIYRLPLQFRIGYPLRYRSLKALVY